MRVGRELRSLRLTTAVLVAAGVWAACGDDDGGPEPPQSVDLSGTYALQSISVDGVPVPGTTGTLTLTASTYAVVIDWPEGFLQPDVDDTGTYVALDNGTWSQNSSGDLPDVQGTWTLVSGTLTVTTIGVVETENVWQSQ